MKVFLFLATMLLSLPHAFATDVTVEQSENQAYEQEYGPMAPADVQELYSTEMNATGDRGAEIIGGLIGGIIGGVIGGGHHGPGHGGGGRYDDISCFARDWRGNTYRATGFNARRVQDRAVRNCEQYSRRRCRPLGCRY